MSRQYRLGRREASVDRTASAILQAARALVSQSPASSVSVGAVARRAGVSRITIYNRFGSRSGLLRALVPRSPTESPQLDDPLEALRRRFLDGCARWAECPGLYRNLPRSAENEDRDVDRRLVERLAAADALRPGCSLKEAEDVLATLGSFAVFDGLYKDGRRTPGAVAEILMRLGSAILTYHP